MISRTVEGTVDPRAGGAAAYHELHTVYCLLLTTLREQERHCRICPWSVVRCPLLARKRGPLFFIACC